MKTLLPIVEGPGDGKAVPVLIRRILEDHKHFDVKVLTPQNRGDLPRIKSNFDNCFKIAIKDNAAILLLIDFDCKDCVCVAKEAEVLYKKATALRAGWPFKVAFMVKEFETLFLADPDATRAVLKDIRESTVFPTDPETIRGAKEWLSRAMPSGYAYKESVHQVKLAAAVDLNRLRQNSASFRHLEKSVLSLVTDEIQIQG